MSEVKPALTRDLWKRFSNSDGALGLRGDGTMWIAPEADETEDLHGTAALALHGQEFGFTWEDVEALEGALGDMMSHQHDRCVYDRDLEASEARQDAVQSILDRIAALLPPRDEGET